MKIWFALTLESKTTYLWKIPDWLGYFIYFQIYIPLNVHVQIAFDSTLLFPIKWTIIDRRTCTWLSCSIHQCVVRDIEYWGQDLKLFETGYSLEMLSANRKQRRLNVFIWPIWIWGKYLVVLSTVGSWWAKC